MIKKYGNLEYFLYTLCIIKIYTKTIYDVKLNKTFKGDNMNSIFSSIALIFSLLVSVPSFAGHCGGDHSHDDKENTVEK